MFDVAAKNKVIGVEDLTNELGNRIRLKFQNGYELSIIQGPYTYGGSEGLYEIAIFDETGVFEETILGDQVKGYLTKEEVMEYYEICLNL